MAELYYDRNKWLRSVIAFIVAAAIFISFVVFRPVESKALAIPLPFVVTGVIAVLLILWGLSYTDLGNEWADSLSDSWHKLELTAEDLVNRIEAADNPVYSHYLEQIYNMESMVVDETYSSVEVSTELVEGFGTMVEDLYDVDLNLQDSLSTSLSVGTRYVMPLESSLAYTPETQSSLPYYTLGNLIAVSSLSLGLNLIYSSDICSLYFYKTDADSVIPIFKIGDYYVRKGSISSISNYISLLPIVTYYDSSGVQITLDSFLGKGYGYYVGSEVVGTLSYSYSEVLSSIGFYIAAINSSGALKNVNLKLGLSDSSSGLYASSDLASVVELTDYLDWNEFCNFSNFTSEYIGNYLNKVSLTFKGIEIVDYIFPFVEARAITQSEIKTQILYHLLNWSLGFTDAAIGSLANESFDVVIDADYLTGEDRYIDTVIASGDSITLKYPTDIGSLSDTAEGSETVAIPTPAEIVVDDSDVNTDTDVGTETDPDGSGSGSSEEETLVIPDVDTSGILHYVEAFLSGIAPFFTWLGSLIMALPTELVVIIFGGLIICIIVGFLSLII